MKTLSCVARLAALVLTTLAATGIAKAAGVPTPAPGKGEEREGPTLERDRGLWVVRRRLGADGRVPSGARSRALQQIVDNERRGLLLPQPLVAGDRWVNIGPGSIRDFNNDRPLFAGRVETIAVHPGDRNTVYLGGAQGGVWKTTDGGLTWRPLTDDQPSLSIGSIALAPSNPNIVYAGTGDPDEGCNAYFGQGLLKSTDAGATWTLLGQVPFQDSTISRVVVHPTNPNVVWVAVTAGTGGFVCYGKWDWSHFGLFKSVDGGVTWTQTFSNTTLNDWAYATDLVIDPGNPNTLFAGFDNYGLWKSIDAGATWTRLQGGLPTADLGRAKLAADAGHANTFYAAFASSSTGTLLGLFKTTNGGTTWTALPSTPSGHCVYWDYTDICTYSGSSNGQCNGDLVLGVGPDSRLWLGGTGLWNSADGGTSWNNTCFASFHVDQHGLAFSLANDVWAGNDGGVFRTGDAGATWSNLNRGLSLTQFYPGGALHPTRAAFIIGGNQDNGTAKYGGDPIWDRVLNTGDGGFGAIDPVDPDHVWYSEHTFLTIQKTTDAGATYVDATVGLDDANTFQAAFIAPFVLCPSNHDVLIAGSTSVWRTNDGADSWSLDSPSPLAADGQPISTVAFAPSVATCATYFAGSQSGHVWRTTDGGATWTDITGALPLFGVSQLVVNPTNASVVWAALSGFGGHHVYRTANALAPAPTWTATDAGIPDTPVNALLVDPDVPTTIYLGTDVGVFRSTDGGTTWGAFDNGHPKMAVYGLVADSATSSIVSFTYGRGAFRLTSSACTLATNSVAAKPGTHDSFTWGGGASFFDVARGSLQSLRAGGGNFGAAICFANDWPDRFTSDASLPAASDAYYYIVRCDAGTYNDTHNTGNRDASLGVCP